ncbi:FAD-dependent oxidoreductase [Nocardia sp. NBC_01009]|uniref:FAD-dependent oxidoreductase n=1 Tax=Nocardia sp. NBC_01009 TaxID=2975996 RepID=UPI00386A2548|nr:NAD(P)-binding protein [Nocardia sp. NBC_01009]
MVTIIGGGIAGTVLAGALARDGVSVTVYERRAAVEEGAFLVLDGRAHDTLGELGVSVANLHAVSHAVDGLAVHEAAAGTGPAMTARRNHIATERANAAQFRPSPPSTR